MGEVSLFTEAKVLKLVLEPLEKLETIARGGKTCQNIYITGF